jgi:hypothetical protein
MQLHERRKPANYCLWGIPLIKGLLFLTTYNILVNFCRALRTCAARPFRLINIQNGALRTHPAHRSFTSTLLTMYREIHQKS